MAEEETIEKLEEKVEEEAEKIEEARPTEGRVKKPRERKARSPKAVGEHEEHKPEAKPQQAGPVHEQIKHFSPKEGIELLKEWENPLLKRKEIELLVHHAGKPTPDRPAIHDSVSAFLKANSDMVIIDRVYTRPGMASSKTSVLVYSRREDIPKGKLEKMSKAGRKKGGEKQPQKEETKPA